MPPQTKELGRVAMAGLYLFRIYALRSLAVPKQASVLTRQSNLIHAQIHNDAL